LKELQKEDPGTEAGVTVNVEAGVTDARAIPQQVRDDRECRGRDDDVMKNVTGSFAP